jgi:predicted small secreted protein
LAIDTRQSPGRSATVACRASKRAQNGTATHPTHRPEYPMNINFRRISLLLLVAAFAFSAAACNTMKGLGKDTEKAGEKIQEEASRSKTTED